jgi:indoleamine 2,3-dioxygenase
MEAMVDVYEGAERKLGKECEEVMELLYVQKETLRKEVEKYCQERNVDAKSA